MLKMRPCGLFGLLIPLNLLYIVSKQGQDAVFGLAERWRIPIAVRQPAESGGPHDGRAYYAFDPSSSISASSNWGGTPSPC